MNDILVVFKNIIPNVVIILTALYIASQDSPLAFIAGAASVILVFAVVYFIITKRAIHERRKHPHVKVQ